MKLQWKLLVVVAVAAVPPMTSACGEIDAVPTPGSRAEAGTWTWGEDAVPGERVDADHATRSVASTTPAVDVTTLREVISVPGVAGRHVLLAASDAAGTPCFSFQGDGAFAKEFQCLNAEMKRQPVLHFAASGGSEPNVVRWSYLLGITRSDVQRVVLTLQDETQLDLPLNEWRAFSYAAASPAMLPKMVTALGQDGGVLVKLNVTAYPLCGGDGGPCPPDLLETPTPPASTGG